MKLPTRRTLGVEAQQLGNELMVRDAHADRLHLLNPSMAMIWTQCDGQRTPEQLAQELAERFDCSDAGDLLAWTHEALGHLAALGLLE